MVQLDETINSSYGQAYFRSKAKQTTNLASINSKEVAGFPFPLTPLSEQLNLIETLELGRVTASRLRAEAAALRAAARVAFQILAGPDRQRKPSVSSL